MANRGAVLVNYSSSLEKHLDCIFPWHSAIKALHIRRFQAVITINRYPLCQHQVRHFFSLITVQGEKDSFDDETGKYRELAMPLLDRILKRSSASRLASGPAPSAAPR